MESVRAAQAPRKLGRPLSFDRDVALHQAMLTFWRHGYETTSVADLTAAMGISTPSLYATFGDKRRLFLEAMRLYAGGADAAAAALDAAPTSRDAARELMTGSAIAYTGENTPKGCLLASATASGSAASIEVRRAVAEVRRGLGRSLQSRIERDIKEGVLPSGTDAAALSTLVMAVTQGMSVLARDGAPRELLLAVAGTALAAWPMSSEH